MRRCDHDVHESFRSDQPYLRTARRLLRDLRNGRKGIRTRTDPCKPAEHLFKDACIKNEKLPSPDMAHPAAGVFHRVFNEYLKFIGVDEYKTLISKYL